MYIAFIYTDVRMNVEHKIIKNPKEDKDVSDSHTECKGEEKKKEKKVSDIELKIFIVFS